MKSLEGTRHGNSPLMSESQQEVSVGSQTDDYKYWEYTGGGGGVGCFLRLRDIIRRGGGGIVDLHLFHFLGNSGNSNEVQLGKGRGKIL